MEMNGIYLLQMLYPNTNGGTLHNFGLAIYISNFIQLHIYSHLEQDYSINEANHAFQDEKISVKFYHSDEKINKYSAKLMLLEPVDSNMLKDISDDITNNDVKVVFYVIRMYEYIRILKNKFPNVKYVYISHNCEYINIASDIKRFDLQNDVPLWKHVIKEARSKAFIVAEKKCLTISDKIFSISPNDSEKLSNRFHIDREKFVTSKPMIRYSSNRSNDSWKNDNFSHKLLIVGNMSWYPTEAGTLWFARSVFPKIKQYDNSCQLYIVGANPTKQIKQLEKQINGIVVTGFVHSVDDYYQSCDIAVIPIFEGTGTKIKALEAVAKQIPAVISTYAAKDYECMQDYVCTANDYDANDFINKVEEYIGNEYSRKVASQKEAEYYANYMKESKPVREYLTELLE